MFTGTFDFAFDPPVPRFLHKSMNKHVRHPPRSSTRSGDTTPSPSLGGKTRSSNISGMWTEVHDC